MTSARPALGARGALVGITIALALATCNKTDFAPRPQHSDVAAAMPDAASTPGAQGPATVAPHAEPPPDGKLPDLTPPAKGPSPTANPADHPD